jgi:sulfite exporter TauE/SafE
MAVLGLATIRTMAAKVVRAIVASALLTCTGCSAIATQLSWQLQEKQAEARESLEISKMDAKPRVNAEE